MENTSRPIGAKFDLAARLVALFGDGDATGAGLSVELAAIHTRYALSTSHVFFRAATGEAERAAAREEFQQIVAAEDFLGELDRLVARAQDALGVRNDTAAPPPGGIRSGCGAAARRGRGRPKAPDADRACAPAPGRAPLSREAAREARTLLDHYAEHDVDCAARAVELSLSTHGERYGVCDDCRLDMSVVADTSELVCPGCGRARELIGTVFDDAQFYNQEGQKAKSGSFNPNRHFRFWMDHILAREPEDELGDKDDPDNACGEKLLKQLLDLVRRDKKILRLLSVDDTRALLKELGRTDLNKNTPLIMRLLTGVGPPCLSEAICLRVEKLFSKAIEIGERIRPAARSNRNYYPFYIYKILDSILPEDDLDSRRVLFYIYMQGQDTLDKNDREWEDICAELPEITWSPTNRSKAQKYRPA
jgi:hypothetical protein